MRAATLVVLAGCGRLGFDPLTSVVDIDASPPTPSCRAMKLAVGARHACVQIASGSLQCFGANNEGELGTGVVSPMEVVPVEVTVVPVGSFNLLATGKGYTCVTDSDDQPNCWGDNGDRQLDGATTGSYHTTPLVITGLALTSMKLGDDFGCGAARTGFLTCWGDGDEGQTGDGTDPDFHTAAPVGLASQPVAHAVGADHACALSAGLAQCWGDGRDGRLGSTAPDTCALASDGSISCSKSPITVTGPFQFAAFALGLHHSCAVSGDGRVACWGRNDLGQCGQAPFSPMVPPLEVSGITSVLQLVAGDDLTCALKLGGSVWCWGKNGSGQLGNNSTGPSGVPVQVQLPLPATEIASHSYALGACAVLDDGSVWCWGDAAIGQLGDGTTAPDARVPRQTRINCP